MIDLHCHILPGVDDGAADMWESLKMARGLADIGFTGACVTPHIPWHTVELEAEGIYQRCEQLSAALGDEGIGLEIWPAAEHFANLVPELLSVDGLVCYPRKETFLMEFPLAGLPPRVWDLLFRVQVRGKLPVIAHLERYPEIQKDPSLAAELREKGCYLLINLTSLVGKWNREAQQAARELLKRGLVDAVSTDMHSADEIGNIAEGLTDLEGRVDADELRRLTTLAPLEIAGISSAKDGCR
jgi:protein-tyrosine phosphatase